MACRIAVAIIAGRTDGDAANLVAEINAKLKEIHFSRPNKFGVKEDDDFKVWTEEPTEEEAQSEVTEVVVSKAVIIMIDRSHIIF